MSNFLEGQVLSQLNHIQKDIESLHVKLDKWISRVEGIEHSMIRLRTIASILAIVIGFFSSLITRILL